MELNDILDGLDGEQKDFLSNYIETNNSNVERINSLERVNKDLENQRATWRQTVRDVAPEEAKKEIDNLKTQLNGALEERNKIKTDYETELNELRISSVLNSLGVETHNSDSFKNIGKLALDGAIYKDGDFVYLNEDGTTRYNTEKKPYSVLVRINELKESDKGYLFVQPKGGGYKENTPPKPSKPNINDIINRGLTY